MNCLTTNTTLYQHQQAAFDKLIKSKVCGLFMEMGTGKTRTAIEFVAARQDKISKVVWCCPVSLKSTIAHEIKKHTGESAYLFDDKTSTTTLPEKRWYIVGLESIGGSDRVYLSLNALIDSNTFVIVDESSYIKGYKAQRTQRLTLISERAKYRMILTGTPISQGIVDLFAQMAFLSKKILGYNSFYAFAANHIEYSDKFKGLIVRAHNTGWIAAKIQPYIYQVTKDECLTLPKKLYDSRYFDMHESQAEEYRNVKEDLLMALSEEWIDSVAIFKAFTSLQQIVSGFHKTKRFDNPRVEMLEKIIAEIPETEKVIIWCKYVFSIHAITDTLRAEFGNDSVSLFYGELSEKERDVELEKFRSSARFFVATQAIGGHGLTLNEAHYVIFYENEFKYAHRLQAEDRNHRIGQDHPVTYIDIICDNSIDERIEAAIAAKSNVVSQFKQQFEKLKDLKKQELSKKLNELVKIY